LGKNIIMLISIWVALMFCIGIVNCNQINKGDNRKLNKDVALAIRDALGISTRQLGDRVGGE